MSRLSQRFASLKSAGRKAVIPYVVAGDPGKDVTVPMMHRLVAAGADVLELGVPFSDPMSEGPVIQRGHERALDCGVSLTDVLAMVREFRTGDPDTPVVMMGYANPVERMGYAEFAAACAEAGVDGLITVGSPLGLDEVQDFFEGWTREDGFPAGKLQGRWVNVYDPLDVVAALDPRIANDFKRAGDPVIEDLREDTWGTWRHSISKYLQRPKLRAMLARMLEVD